MELSYFTDQEYNNISSRTNSLQSGEYENCRFSNCDFSECDLTGSSFPDSDLSGAVFDNTNLEKVDFLSAVSYSLDPGRNRLKKTRFSTGGLPGLLGRYDIIIG